MKNLTNHKTRFICMLIISMMMIQGCRTKKSTLEKKEERISEIQQNNIKINKDIIEASEMIRLSSSDRWSFESKDPAKRSFVISGGDTLEFENAKIEINKDQTSSKKISDKNTKIKKEDLSRNELDKASKEKTKNSNVKSASWGLNLGVIFGIIALIALGYFHFQIKGASKD